jgi:hypothetical protein
MRLMSRMDLRESGFQMLSTGGDQLGQLDGPQKAREHRLPVPKVPERTGMLVMRLEVFSDTLRYAHQLATGAAGAPVGRNGSANISALAAPARNVSRRAALTICGLPHR